MGLVFLVNRLLFPYLNEALVLIEEGVEIKAIERAAKSFGMPMGPITLYDVVGLDTALYAGQTMKGAFPDRAVLSPILSALIDAGRLGQKNRAGFFSYKDKKGKGQPDPAAQKILAPHLKPASEKKLSEAEIIDRLFLPMLLEATRVLDEKIVRSAQDVDLGLIFGIGFPPFKGGLLHWADSLGVLALIEKLTPLASLGARYEVTPYLQNLADQNQTFYGA